MLAFYADQFVLPLPANHRFPMAKYRRLRERIAAELPVVQLAEAPAASDGILALVHTPTYIESIAVGSISAQGQRDIGFPWSEAMVARARRSVGATIAAARVALGVGGAQRQGIAGNLA